MDIVEEKNKLGPILRLVDGGKHRASTVDKAKRDLGIPEKITQRTPLPDIGVTVRQEKFAQCVAKNMSQAEAYKASYNAGNMADSTIYSKASELAKSEKVKARIEYWRDQYSEVTTHSPEYLRAFIEKGLLRIANDPRARPNDQMKAYELLGKLTKVAAFSERTEIIEQLPDNSDDIKERIEQVLAKSA